LSMLHYLVRKRKGLPPPVVSKSQAVELAIAAWEQTGIDGRGSFSTMGLSPFVREALEEYKVSFSNFRVMVNPKFFTVYHVNNQTGEVRIEQIDRWEERAKQRDKLLLRPAAGSTDTLLRSTQRESSSQDALLRSCESDATEGETSS
jgi:hypothetical protein